VGRGEFDLVGARPEECAGRLADAGRDALGVAARQIEHVDLIEGVARLALALEHEACAIRRPVALAGAFAFHRQTADAAEKITFLVDGRILPPNDDAGEDGCREQGGHQCAAKHGHLDTCSQREKLIIVAGRRPAPLTKKG